MPVPLIIDDDGNNFFHHLTDDPDACARELIEDLPASVTDYMLCIGAGTYYYPTKLARVDPRATMLSALHARGVDPFGILTGALRKSGRRTFITCRMNDVHNPTDADEWNLPLVRKKHPDAVVDWPGVQAGKTEWMSYCLDYSRKEVMDYFVPIFTEIVERYHGTIDGLQMDWMRFPRHLSGTPEEVWAKRGHITEFTATVREMMRRVDPRLKLSVRVPAHAEGCRYVGLDVPEWVKRALVDQVVMCPFLTTDFFLPVEEMRKWMGGRVPLYAGHDFHFGGQNPNPESLRGTSASLLDCGADGIYLFNFPCWIEYLAVRPWHWLADLPGTIEGAPKPMLVAVSHARHRLPFVDPPSPLPMKVAAGKSASLEIRVPRSAMPLRRAVMLIHSGGDVRTAVNGHDAPSIDFPANGQTGGRAEIFMEYIDPALNETRPKTADCRVFRVEPAWLQPGVNAVTVANTGEREIEIGRVNLGLW